MTRGAINNYYSQVLKLIALPTDQNKVKQMVQDYLPAVDNVKTFDEALSPVQYGQGPIKKAFEGIGQADVSAYETNQWPVQSGLRSFLLLARRQIILPPALQFEL